MAKLQQRSHKAMGGEFLVQFWGSHQDLLDWTEKIDKGFAIVDGIEAKCTDFKDSPFQKINQNAGIKPVEVDEEIYSLILKAHDFSQKSQGAFDISYASVGHLWRQARKQGVLVAPEEIEASRRWIDYRKIELNHKMKQVFLPHQCMKIGLGGIGKGYAVDRLFEYLESHGMSNFLVNGSGDLRVHSSPDAPREWRLGIKNPFSAEDKTAGYVKLKNSALATSGDYKQYVKSQAGDHRKFHHIIETSTGFPSVDFASVTVIAPTTLEADVLATAVMSMDEKNGIDLLKKQNVTYVCIKTNGLVLKSEGA